MKALERNKQLFYYSNYVKTSESLLDEWGNTLGEYSIERTDPIPYLGNISGAVGDVATRQFGENLNYDKVIVLDDPNIEIDEYSVLWVDKEPTERVGDDENVTPHDYEVKKIARTLNNVSIAIEKVEISE